MNADIIDNYSKSYKEVLSYFDIPLCAELPIDDCRGYYWKLTGENEGDKVKFAKELCHINDDSKNNVFYNNIRRHICLRNSVYRTVKYTAVLTNHYVDNEGLFIRIFDNLKEA